MRDSIIPYGKQEITDEDIETVVTTLRSPFLTQGPKIKEFEIEFAKYVGAQYAVAVANGTAALHLCALALGVKPGTRVITTPITFAASANCVRYCGGEVVFADIDRDTYLLDIAEVRKKIEAAPSGTFSGIIPVDFGGKPIDMEAFRELAEEHNLWIIEDACHAPGGYFVDKNSITQRCGNGVFADLSIFSFHPVKHIACGEGGMITTNDHALYEKLLLLRTHGITRDLNAFTNPIALAASDPTASEFPGWYMEMQELGFNYRITDFQAALGKSQLSRADANLQRRHVIAARYDRAFRDVAAITSQTLRSGKTNDLHAFHLYIIEVENRLALYNYLRSKNIFAQIHYFPCHLMPYYRDIGWHVGDMPAAENYYSKCVSLPMYPTLTDEEQEYVINCILNFVKVNR